ncbi:unnamed protein product [Lepeophtheirus salmonis]|uniref:(salmon louse) hypothetical protein n=1 Tax=Lepeophtheirus salmonis TaxID=72036 RepID=A0A7R8H9A4_LEPSM|nr:unnamed protein product [Lepeophtheirus salmonis]CAF2937910.1 unnamed protein product [Lepeophtheirus salmonis]
MAIKKSHSASTFVQEFSLGDYTTMRTVDDLLRSPPVPTLYKIEHGVQGRQGGPTQERHFLSFRHQRSSLHDDTWRSCIREKEFDTLIIFQMTSNSSADV